MSSFFRRLGVSKKSPAKKGGSDGTLSSPSGKIRSHRHVTFVDFTVPKTWKTTLRDPIAYVLAASDEELAEIRAMPYKRTINDVEQSETIKSILKDDVGTGGVLSGTSFADGTAVNDWLRLRRTVSVSSSQSSHSTASKASGTVHFPQGNNASKYDHLNAGGMRIIVDPERHLSGLSRDFYKETFDPTVSVLSDLPDYSALEQSDPEEAGQRLQMYILEKMSSFDSAQDALRNKLSRHLMRNNKKLLKGMQTVQDVDLDMTRAIMFVRSCQAKLLRARRSTVDSTLQIVRKKRTVARMQEVQGRMRGMVKLHALRASMEKAASLGSVAQAVTMCTTALTELESSAELVQYDAMKGLHSRLRSYLPRLRQQADGLLTRYCISFDPSGYPPIVGSYRAWTIFGSAKTERKKEGTSPLLQPLYAPNQMASGVSLRVSRRKCSASSVREFGGFY